MASASALFDCNWPCLIATGSGVQVPPHSPPSRQAKPLSARGSSARGPKAIYEEYKEKINAWLAEIATLEQEQKDLFADLGERARTRRKSLDGSGAAEAPAAPEPAENTTEAEAAPALVPVASEEGPPAETEVVTEVAEAEPAAAAEAEPAAAEPAAAEETPAAAE